MLLLAFTLICKGQKNLTTFGFTYKPMIAGSLINEGESIEKENNIEYEVTKLFGYNAGMVIRHNFTKMFALETGISFTKRNFKMTVNDLSNNYFFERFGAFQYFHAASIFLKDVLPLAKHGTGPKMHLNVQEEQLDVIILEEGKLLLCNSFLFKTSEDFIYYILFCLEQLKLNPDSIPLILSGSIDKEDSNYELLYTYVRNISFVEDTSGSTAKSTTEVYHNNYLLKNSY